MGISGIVGRQTRVPHTSTEKRGQKVSNESPLEMGGTGKGPKLVDHLLYEPEESGILWIKFNRPERMNALIGNSQENGTVAKVGEYMRAGDDDPNIRVIVLTGVGRGFCSGADMRRDNDPSVTGVAPRRDRTQRGSTSSTGSPTSTATSR